MRSIPAMPGDNSVGISIAGLGVALESANASVLAALARRYRNFQPALPPVWRVAIQAQINDQPPGFLHAQPVFSGTTIRFDSEHYQGEVDLEAQRAEIRIASSQPEIDTDYFLRVVFAELAFQAGGVLFHAAAIQRYGRGVLFFGHSGSGKTTVARNSPAGSVLNDDLVILLPEAGQWIVYGTPFWNPTQVTPSAQSAPVAMLLRLVQDKRVYLEEMGRGQASAELIASIPVVNADLSRSIRLLSRCRELSAALPVFNLHFLPDDSFWMVIEDYLKV